MEIEINVFFHVTIFLIPVRGSRNLRFPLYLSRFVVFRAGVELTSLVKQRNKTLKTKPEEIRK